MEPMTIDFLIDGLEEIICDASDAAQLVDVPISGIEYDSRRVNKDSLFVCVKGEKADGHDFAADAVAKGAVALAVEYRLPLEIPQIVFSDTRLSLGLLARNLFGNPSAALNISAITGTNGKTTTTYLVEWISRYILARRSGLSIESAQAFTGLIGTVETRIGTTKQPSSHTTPESSDLQALLFQMSAAGVSHVSMEASSHAIELNRLAGVSINTAAFSNLTQDHLDFHGDMESYFEAKATLFDSKDVVNRVINISNEYGKKLALQLKAKDFKVLTCGFDDSADIFAKDINYGFDSTKITLVTPKGVFDLTYPLIGSYNVENILLAACVAYANGFDIAQIVEALSLSPQIPGRMERVQIASAQPSAAVFVDYSHTPDSIEKAIAALNAIKKNRVIIVFGCGGDRDRTKRPLMGAAALSADFAIVTSDNPRSEDPLLIIDDILEGMKGFESKFAVEPNRDTAIAKAIEIAGAGDYVLIAGKGHEDYQIVGDKVLDFDDRLVAAKHLLSLAGFDQVDKGE